MADYGSLDGGRSKRDRFQQTRTRLWSERASFDAHWKEISDWLLPRRTRFWAGDRNRGDKRNQNVINSTARFAARTLSAGMHAGLTSPARPWMKLGIPDRDLAKHPPVKAWLHELTQRMLDIFAVTNLYQTLPNVYGDMGSFGTAAVGILEDDQDLFRAYAYPLGSYALGLDRRGLVTTFVREYEMTVGQVVEEFAVPFRTRLIDWSKVSTTIKLLWDRGEYEAAVKVTWIVAPNHGRNPDRFLPAESMPWASCHYETQEDKEGLFLRESGFRTFPVLAPRWDVTGEDSYGIDCPGMIALGDIKQLQTQERRKGQGIAKQIDPPMTGPTSLRTQKTSVLPSDVTYVDVREGMKGFEPAYQPNFDLSHLTADMSRVEYRIQRAYYEDLFLMLATLDPARGTQPATAREIDERHEEKLLALGPTLERTDDELLDRLVDRTYALMDAHGMIPEPPDELDGMPLKVEYTSMLAQAQKLIGVGSQDRFLATVLPLAEAFPEVRHKIDPLRVVDNYGDMLGVDPRIIRSDEDAEARIEQEAEVQKAALEAQQAEQVAGAMQKAGGTPMGGDSALTRVVESAAGGA